MPIVKFFRVLSVHSSAPWVSSDSLSCVQPIPVRPGDLRVRLGELGPFTCALGVVCFVRVRSVHFLRPGGLRGRSGAFGPFTYALGFIGFVCVRSVHFHCAVV